MLRTTSSSFLTFSLTIAFSGWVAQASGAETGSEAVASPLPARSAQDADPTDAQGSERPTEFRRGEVVFVVSPETRLMLGEELVAVLAMGTEFLVSEVRGSWVGGQVEVEGEEERAWVYRGHLRRPASETTGPIAADMIDDRTAAEDDFTIRSLVVSDDAQLAAIDPSARIGRLVLVGDGLTSASLENLEKLAHVDELSIESTQIGDNALAHLKKRTDVRSLRLWRCLLSDAALQHLKNLTGLESLDLEGTTIRGTGLEYLKDLPKLRTLILGSGIDDAGLEHVEDLAGLEELDLRRCLRVTDAGKIRLKEALPNCKLRL